MQQAACLKQLPHRAYCLTIKLVDKFMYRAMYLNDVINLHVLSSICIYETWKCAFMNNSISSRIQKGPGATYPLGHPIMHDGYLVWGFLVNPQDY